MLQKSPKYKLTDLSTIKDRQRYFKTLTDEVNKSRMAVETITSFKNSELNFKKKIDEIQDELQSSISRINLQSKKNVVLKQLINLMKGQMFNFQKTLKKQEEKNESQVQKKIKKIQYDIEQILQKHNEEIAKINSLKQSASSGRSQRVVFSNLFKKLEKQIKQSQEIYRQNLIKSLSAKDKCKSKPVKLFCRVSQRDFYQNEIANKKHSENNMTILPVQNNFFTSNDQDTAFITLPKQANYEKESRKRNNAAKQLSHSHIYQVKNSSRKFNDLISTYQNFIDKIKVHMEFSDLKEGLAFYQKIQGANQNLMSQIQNIEEEICHYENQIRDIQMQKRRSECYENAKQLPIGSCRRIRLPTEKTDKSDDDNDSQNQRQILTEISQILNLPLVSSKFDDDQLRILDSRLDEILQETKSHQQLFNTSKNQPNRATTAHSQGNVVDILLERMDKFNQCEKILDRNLFKQQYFKELGKTKKHKSKK